MRDEYRTRLVFKVIVSEDDQYSLWLLDREDPPGWRDTGHVRGSATECLAHIREIYFRERHVHAEPVSSSKSRTEPASKAVYA